MYYLYYALMLVGFLGLSIMSGDVKSKLMGILLTIVNAIIFFK